MNGYRPARAAHAVQQAIVGVRLLKPTDDSTFEQAVTLAKQIADSSNVDLPGKVQLDPLSMVFGRQVITPGFAKTGELSPGWVFQRTDNAGVMQEELTLEKSAVTYRTTSYVRWENVSEFIKEIIIPVAEIMADGRADSLSVIELRCIDQFISDSGAVLLNRLVREDCPFVAPDLLGRDDMLHCHAGWFENVSNVERTLVNLNLDIGEMPDGKRMATILQVVSKHFSGIGEVNSIDKLFFEHVTDTFKYLHKYDKYLLSKILSDHMQDSIGLKSGSGVEKP